MKQLNISRAEKIDGWMKPISLIWLAEQASECGYIAELGIYCGRSTVAMLDNSDAHLWCVDTWRYKKCTERMLRTFEQNIASQRDRVTILQMTTHEAAQELAETQFDMVFIDACHDYDIVKQDILDYRPLVKPGGLFCGHDYNRNPGCGVVQAVDELVPGFQRYGRIWWKRL